MNLRRLWTLVRREVQATLRDPFTLTILVSVPVAALMMFGFVLATDVKHLSLGVHDASRTQASRRLIADLTAGETFDVRPYGTTDAIGEGLVSGDISVGVVIPPDFDDDLSRAGPGSRSSHIQVLYDGGEAVLAGNAEAFLRSLVGATTPALLDSGGPPHRDPTGDAAEPSSGVGVVTRAVFNPRLEGKPFMVAGTFGFVLSFLTTLITAVSVVNEKLQGTFEQLQVTPATSLEILLGKLLPLGAVFALDVVLMVLIAGFVLGVWPEGSALLFVAISAYYVLISLALGLIFSATSATAAEAVQKTVLFSIPLIQLSGFLFPVRSLPSVVRWLAELLPATHYIQVSRAIYLRGEGLFTMIPDLLVLLFYGVFLVSYALRAIEARA
jgi:ABC-2 type transport system permease protein